MGCPIHGWGGGGAYCDSMLGVAGSCSCACSCITVAWMLCINVIISWHVWLRVARHSLQVCNDASSLSSRSLWLSSLAVSLRSLALSRARPLGAGSVVLAVPPVLASARALSVMSIPLSSAAGAVSSSMTTTGTSWRGGDGDCGVCCVGCCRIASRRESFSLMAAIVAFCAVIRAFCSAIRRLSWSFTVRNACIAALGGGALIWVFACLAVDGPAMPAQLIYYSTFFSIESSINHTQ